MSLPSGRDIFLRFDSIQGEKPFEFHAVVEIEAVFGRPEDFDLIFSDRPHPGRGGRRTYRYGDG